MYHLNLQVFTLFWALFIRILGFESKDYRLHPVGETANFSLAGIWGLLKRWSCFTAHAGGITFWVLGVYTEPGMVGLLRWGRPMCCCFRNRGPCCSVFYSLPLPSNFLQRTQEGEGVNVFRGGLYLNAVDWRVSDWWCYLEIPCPTPTHRAPCLVPS